MTYTRNQNRYPEAHLNQHKPVTGRGRAKLNRESEPSNFSLLDDLLLKILSLSRTARRRLYKQQHTRINSSGTAKHACINQIEHLFGLESTCTCRRTKQNWPQPPYSLTRTQTCTQLYAHHHKKLKWSQWCWDVSDDQAPKRSSHRHEDRCIACRHR